MNINDRGFGVCFPLFTGFGDKHGHFDIFEYLEFFMNFD